MHLPFTTQQFLEVFRKYNEAVWPVQVIFYILAVFVVLSASKRNNERGKFISAVLGILWIWMGVIYHLVFFTTINKAAWLFGTAFILQGILFFYDGVLKQGLKFQIEKNVYGITGAVMVIFALIIYPVLGFIQGHIYPYSPTFGLPCPTTIFTFGVLLWTAKKIPLRTWLIPLVWSFIGFSAATSLGIHEDTGLLVAGIVASLFLWRFPANK
jgi:hypothetical protein